MDDETIQATGQIQLNNLDLFLDFFRLAGVAQLVEQLICNQRVGGSNPLAGSVFKGKKQGI